MDAIRFVATPAVPGAGFFEREGIERRPAGKDEKGHPYAIIAGCCARCGGAGQSDKWIHTGKVCYDCGGSGYSANRQVRLYSAEELAKLNAARDKSRAAKAAKSKAAAEERARVEGIARQERADQLAQDPFVIRLHAMAERSDFLGELAARVEVADLSEAQVLAALNAMDRIEERDALKAKDALSEWLGDEGQRIQFEGEVAFVHQVAEAGYGRFGYQGDKFLVKIRCAQGLAVWFGPSYYAVGRKLKGKATVKEQKIYKDVKESVVFRVKLEAAA